LPHAEGFADCESYKRCYRSPRRTAICDRDDPCRFQSGGDQVSPFQSLRDLALVFYPLSRQSCYKFHKAEFNHRFALKARGRNQLDQARAASLVSKMLLRILSASVGGVPFRYSVLIRRYQSWISASDFMVCSFCEHGVCTFRHEKQPINLANTECHTSLHHRGHIGGMPVAVPRHPTPFFHHRYFCCLSALWPHRLALKLCPDNGHSRTKPPARGGRGNRGSLKIRVAPLAPPCQKG
jgi:hypothetical protein